LLSEKHFNITILAILREICDELFKSTSLFYQIEQDDGHTAPVKFPTLYVPFSNVLLIILKVVHVNVNVDSHKFGYTMWTFCLILNLTECLI
jgi:hypothetical protein